MADFKKLISVISASIERFNNVIPGIQENLTSSIQLMLKDLNVKGDSIKISVANLKLLTKVKANMQKLLLTDEYVSSVKDYLGVFDEVTSLQHDYFASIEERFRPPKLAAEIKRQAMASVASQLLENGLAANVVDKVADLLRKSITSGGSYQSMNKSLADYINNTDSGEGVLQHYTKQVTTDAVNQFSGQYTQIISSDLGYEWFRYSGSNLDTTRPFCLACTERKFFHITELPKVLKGEFEEFKRYDGVINQKAGLPAGMIPGTDVSNFMVNRGGYNCGHQWRPVSEDLVPEERKKAVYMSAEYKAWKKVA